MSKSSQLLYDYTMEDKRGLIPVVGGEPPVEVGRGGSPPDKFECSEVLDCDEDLLVDLLACVALRGPDCTLDFLELAMVPSQQKGGVAG